MVFSKLTKLGVIGTVAAAAVAGLPSSAAAQRGGADGSTSTIFRTEPGGGTLMTVRSNVDGREFFVEYRDDKLVRAELDGRPIPADQIRRKDGLFEVLDGQGKVIHTTTAPQTHIRVGEGAWADALRGQRWEVRAPAAPVAPKVMAGVTMASPDSSLARHFDLKPSDATVLVGVYDGLPAAEAGLRPYDIVIEINGKTPAGQELLRAALARAEPGETLRLTVLQRGQRKEVNLKLAEYDRQRLNEATARFRAEQGARGLGAAIAPHVFGEFPAGVHGIEPLVLDNIFVGQREGIDAERLREQMVLLQRDAVERAAEARRMAEEAIRLRVEAEGLGRAPRTRPETALESPPAAPEQMERLEDRLERLERMLRELTERELERSKRGD